MSTRKPAGDCPECGLDLSAKTTTELPGTAFSGLSCPDCRTHVYCGICGDLTE